MDEDRISGVAKNFGGKIEEGIGSTVGDEDRSGRSHQQMTGAAQNAYGQMKHAAGQAADSAGDAAQAVRDQIPPMERAILHSIENSPYTAVTIAFGVALGIGWVLGGSSSDYRPGGYP